MSVTRKSFTGHVGAISDALKVRCNESMLKARELVKWPENELGQEPEDGIYNIAVSHDATWQKRGFTSLYGAVFVISELTGQVFDYEFIRTTVVLPMRSSSSSIIRLTAFLIIPAHHQPWSPMGQSYFGSGHWTTIFAM